MGVYGPAVLEFYAVRVQFNSNSTQFDAIRRIYELCLSQMSHWSCGVGTPHTSQLNINLVCVCDWYVWTRCTWVLCRASPIQFEFDPGIRPAIKVARNVHPDASASREGGKTTCTERIHSWLHGE